VEIEFVVNGKQGRRIAEFIGPNLGLNQLLITPISILALETHVRRLSAFFCLFLSNMYRRGRKKCSVILLN
jgi:hypothetical protein